MFSYIYESGLQLIQNVWQGTVNLAGQAVQRLPAVPNQLRDNTISRFSRSILGRMFVRAQAENAAECAGYYACVYTAAPAASHIGRGLSRFFISKTAPFWGRIAASGTSFQMIYNHFVRGRMNSTILSLAQLTAIVTAVLASDAAIALGNSENVESYLVDHEETIGQITIDYGIGLLAAFLAMKLTNTPEVFWDSENIPQSYLFKALQSMLFCDLLNYAGAMPSHPVIGSTVTVICGSLAYNLLDIVDVSNRAIQGNLLNDTLPRDLQIQYEALNEESIHQALRSSGNFVFEHRKELIQGETEALETIINDLILSNAINLMTNQSVADHISQTNFVQQCNETSADKITTVLVRALNCYTPLLLHSPQFFENLTRIWNEQFANASSKERRTAMFDEISNHGEIQQLLAQHLTVDFPNVNLDTKLQIADAAAPSISRRQIQETAQWILERLRRFEHDMIGTPLVSENQIAMQRENLELHIEKICAIASLFVFSSMTQPLEPAEIRRFYIHSSRLGKQHYTFLLNDKVSSLIQKFLERQIEHSIF